MAYDRDRVMTSGQIEDLITMQLQAVKDWCLNNVDSFAVMQVIAAGLDEANREIVPGNSAAKLQVLNSSLNKIYEVLMNKGADVANTKLAELAEVIASMTSSHEVCLIGASGTKYSAGEWQLYTEMHGTQPENAAVPAIITPYESFVIAPVFTTLQYGTTGSTVTGLFASQTGSFVNVLQNNLIFAGYENTRRTLLFADPDVLGWKQWDANDKETNWGSIPCIHFASHAEMIAANRTLQYDQQIYVVDNDETITDGSASTSIAYYWNGASYTKRFQVPLTDTQKIKGAPVAKYCWNFKAWEGDTRQWFGPTINHLLLMHVYKAEIDTCLYALNRGTLPADTVWTMQEISVNGQYSVALSSGQVGNTSKYGSTGVVAVAALKQ